VPAFAESDQHSNVDAHHDGEFGQREGDALKKREQWFYSHHQLPNGKPATDLFKKAQETAHKLPAAAQKMAGGPRTTPPGSVPSTWTSLGPAPIRTGTGFTADPMPVSGRVSSIAISTTQTGETLYVGAADGGVWKSTDNGQRWTPLTDSQASLAIGCIAVDPRNPKYVYAGTGEMHLSGDSYFGRGVLKSVDGGRTWTLYGASTFDGQHISSIIVDPTHDNIVYVAADKGIYKSTNYGVSYQRLYIPDLESDYSYVVDLKMDPLDSKVLYASILGQGIFKTTDGGFTWTLLNTDDSGLPTSGFDVAAVAIGTHDENGQNADNVVYAAFSDSTSGDLLGLYKSTDGGTTWAKLDNVPDYFDEGYAYEGEESGTGQGWYDNTLAVDPSNPDHVLAGGITLIETKDGGSTWTNLADPASPSVNIHPDQHAITFDAVGNAFIGNDGGVWEYKADGTWANLNTNLSITQFYPGMSTTGTGNNRIIIGGTQDNGTNRYNGSTVWDQIFGGDGGYTAIDPTNPDKIYVEAEGGDIYQITDSGQNYAPVSPNYQPDEFVPFIVPFILEPSDSTKILVGAGYLHEGQYNGDSGTWDWNIISSRDFSQDYGINAIAQSATNPDTIYVGTGDGMVFATFDHGQTWTDITPAYADFGLPVSGIVIDPNNDKSIFVAYGGYSYPYRNDHVFYTADASAPMPSWANLTGNLPNVPINAIALKQGNLYVGTDVGVFVAAQGSKFWSSLNAGLPNTPVTSLTFTPDNQLIAGTHGRGVFITDVSSIATQSLLSITPGNQQLQIGQSVNLKAQLTVNGKSQDVTTSVTWRSQNPTIASVNSLGQVIGRSVGNATITATYKGQVATVSVKVTPAIVGLAIVPPTTALTIDTPVWVSVLAQYADGSFEDVTDVASLTSSTPSVATVDDQGLVTPKHTGTTNISASFGGKKVSQTVIVTPPVVDLTATLTMNNKPTSVVPLTQSATLTVTATFEDQPACDVTKFANIQSVNGNVAVSGNKVTGIDKGDDTLVIQFGGQSTYLDIKVTAALKSIAITPKPPLFYEAGATKQLTAVATYIDGSTSDITSDDNASWSTANSGVATVEDGVLTAVAPGTTTITFTYPGQSPIKIPVTITQPATINSVTPTKAAPGQTVTITGKNFDLPGTVTIGGQTAQVRSWSTSSIQVVVPSVDIGPASITVQPDGGGASATYDNFTVLPAAPLITGVQPSSAYAGQTVTIQGTFQTINGHQPTVTFGSTAATVKDATTNAITVEVPQVAPGKPAIVVTTDGGKSAPYTGFTVLPGPTITAVSPTSASWGQSVTITGNNFGTNRGNVSIGGQSATITKWTNTSISITVPAVGAGKQPVIVTNADGISSAPFNGFTVTAPPVTQLVFLGVQNNETSGTQGSPVFVQVKALDSNGKPVAGQPISFSSDGGDLSNTSAVTNAQGIAAVAVNNNDLTVVHLTASWGTSGSVKQSLTIDYSPGQPKAMVVTRISNTYIYTGETISVYGRGFGQSQGNGAFTFSAGNETKAATVQNWSDTEIDVVVPQFQSQINAGDTLTFTITNDTGASFTCPSGYVYWSAPASGLQIYDVFGDAADGRTVVPGTKIHIAGSGFGDTPGSSVIKLGSTTLQPSMVDYGDGNGPVPDWSDTWITCDVPSNVQTGTSVTLSITVDGKTVTKSVKVQALPAVTSVVPDETGTTWTISGVNLGTQGTLSIDGTPINGTWSSTRITFTLPFTLPDGINDLEIKPTVGGVFQWPVPWPGSESPDWTIFTEPYVYVGATGTSGYILTGQSFGNSPGIVLVNGVLAGVTNWTNDEIDLATTVPSGAWIEVVNEYGLAVFYHNLPTPNSSIRKLLQLHQSAVLHIG
jgi:hypothetical protein